MTLTLCSPPANTRWKVCALSWTAPSSLAYSSSALAVAEHGSCQGPATPCWDRMLTPWRRRIHSCRPSPFSAELGPFLPSFCPQMEAENLTNDTPGVGDPTESKTDVAPPAEHGGRGALCPHRCL